jgi:hypothetical protein
MIRDDDKISSELSNKLVNVSVYKKQILASKVERGTLS